MTPTGFFIIFALSWWFILFMVLPVGVHVPDHHEEGHAASAPKDPRLGAKFVITTLIAAAITLGTHYCFLKGIFVWPA